MVVKYYLKFEFICTLFIIQINIWKCTFIPISNIIPLPVMYSAGICSYQNKLLIIIVIIVEHDSTLTRIDFNFSNSYGSFLKIAFAILLLHSRLRS